MNKKYIPKKVVISMFSSLFFILSLTLMYLSYLNLLFPQNEIFFATTSLISLLLSIVFAYMSFARHNNNKKTFTKSKGQKKIVITTSTILTVCYMLFVGLSKYYWCYGAIDGEQIFYHMLVSSSGMDFSTVFTIAIPTIIAGIIFAVAISYIFYCILYIIQCKQEKKRDSIDSRLRIFSTFISSLSVILIFVYLFNVIPIAEFIYYQNFTKSTFIQDNYVNPQSTEISFPQEKRNLIYIYMESMENTFADIENGGAFEDNLIPEITKLKNENITFSNTDKFGGALNTYGMTYTTAGFVAQSFGLPLKVGQKSFTQFPNSVLPNLYNIFDILNDAGYSQHVVMGSSADFGGLIELFSSHGDVNVYDYNAMIAEGFIDKDYRVFWGVEDKLMYEYSKQKLNIISQANQPFFFVMETVDTHNPDGWLCDECAENFPTRYENVVSCASKQVDNFIKWAQEQSWYENTTIVIVGDHLSMKNDFFTDIPSNYERTTLNIIINPAQTIVLENVSFNHRQFCSADMFPTVLCAIGCKIDGERLGIGTNLFSDRKTVFEEFGFEYVNTEFRKKSTFTQSVFE